MRHQLELRQLLADHAGVLRRADHPDLSPALDWGLRSGRLVRVLPGVLAASEVAAQPATRARALGLWHPDAVLIGSAAIGLQYWQGHPCAQWSISVPTHRRPPDGWDLTRMPVDPGWVVQHHGVRMAHPAWNAVWLSARDEGLAIDEGLRRRVFTVGDCEAALSSMQGRPGQAARRFVVHHSRENPWSPAERRLHLILRRHRVTGWRGNVRVPAPDGRSYFLDVAFEAPRVFLEVQSWLHHGTRHQFHRDNEKFAWLTSRGWRGIPVDWPLMDREAVLVQWVRDLLDGGPAEP